MGWFGRLRGVGAGVFVGPFEARPAGSGWLAGEVGRAASDAKCRMIWSMRVRSRVTMALVSFA
ncbi:hypothetical protein [Acidiphilium acidophilum]|uniref:hypothetical protein n=1 Tax=Acidiphilium acidophilum TaxID=76588 RepID=UPI002E8E7395|nr:hypothetical protein [Acidiphilium acidophilum]